MHLAILTRNLVFFTTHLNAPNYFDLKPYSDLCRVVCKQLIAFQFKANIFSKKILKNGATCCSRTSVVKPHVRPHLLMLARALALEYLSINVFMHWQVRCEKN